MSTVVVDGEHLTLESLEEVARRGASVALSSDPSVRSALAASEELRRRAVAEGRPVYGVTTGPGFAVTKHVGTDRAARLQESLVSFMGCGVGAWLPLEESRAFVLARMNCLARGHSGVRALIVERLAELLNRDVVPCVPSIGSVGASGDLAPASYLAAVLMGRRQVFHSGRIRPTAEVFRELGIEAVTLEAKEGLALLNGTNFMTGIGALAALDAGRLADLADACTAMTTEVLTGLTAPFDAFLHERAKRHPGQARSAGSVRRLLAGSRLARDYEHTVAGLSPRLEGVGEVEVALQDPYSVRCAPQCVGALHDVVAWVRGVLEAELNSTNDNPLFDVQAGRIRTGGNFSGFHVGIAMDTLKNAVASVADLLDRQFQLIADEKANRGLGSGCAHPVPDDHPDAGTHFGFKGMQLVVSAVAAEALNACTPMTAFSRSTASHNQDKVSMAATAARQAAEVVDLCRLVVAMHLLILAQAADLRGPERLAPGTRRIYDAVRRVSGYVEADREMDTDIRAVAELVRSGELHGIVFPA